MRNYILTQHNWKLLHDLIFTRIPRYEDVWLFNKTFNHEFEGVYCGQHKLFWLWIEFFQFENWSCELKYCLHIFKMNTKQWDRLSWKTVLAMILANITKWASSQLFACGSLKLGTLERGHLRHLMFITALLLVCPVGHIDPHITDWVTKPRQMLWTGNLPICQLVIHFFPFILSLDCQEYNYSSWDLIFLVVPEKSKCLQRSMLNIYLKWLIAW